MNFDPQSGMKLRPPGDLRPAALEPAATPRQLEACKRIAERTGRTFALPLSKLEAHKIIGRDAATRRRKRSRPGARAGPS